MNDLTTIHVRFAPNGDVTEIGAKPEALTPQQWFDMLMSRYPESYQTFMGGRAIFRLPAETIVQLQAESTQEST
jgi:hypothetical protein